MTTATTTVQYTAQDILGIAEQLERKFEPQDIEADPALGLFALVYIRDYDGTFEYMCSLQDQMQDGRKISLGMLKGALNCAVAQFRREASQPPVGSAIRNGFYTIVFEDGDHITLRVQAHWEKSRKDEQVVGYLSGPNNTSDYTNFAFARGTDLQVWRRYQGATRPQLAWQILTGMSDPEVAGREYALQSGNCWVCGRTLTTPESIERGIGPVCWENR